MATSALTAAAATASASGTFTSARSAPNPRRRHTRACASASAALCASEQYTTERQAGHSTAPSPSFSAHVAQQLMPRLRSGSASSAANTDSGGSSVGSGVSTLATRASVAGVRDQSSASDMVGGACRARGGRRGAEVLIHARRRRISVCAQEARPRDPASNGEVLPNPRVAESAHLLGSTRTGFGALARVAPQRAARRVGRQLASSTNTPPRAHPPESTLVVRPPSGSCASSKRRVSRS